MGAENATAENTPSPLEAQEPSARPTDDAIRRQFLTVLQRRTGLLDLAYAKPPARVRGGYSGALIYRFQLRNAPEELRGSLVLRVLLGDQAEETLGRECCLQQAAAELGYPAPRILLKELDRDALGGPFMVMDRLRGGQSIRWFFAGIGIGLAVALWLGQLWPILAGYASACLILGGVLGALQRKLHRLPAQAVAEFCRQHGLPPSELSPARTIASIAEIMDQASLRELDVGIEWLRRRLPRTERPVFCHGDFHPLNLVVTPLGVSGVVDWGDAKIADPEFDIAIARCDMTLLPPWPSNWLVAPVYAVYWLSLRMRGRIDRARLRYFEALRVLLMLALFCTAAKPTGVGAPPLENAPKLPPWFLRQLIARHVRRFRELTGVDLQS